MKKWTEKWNDFLEKNGKKKVYGGIAAIVIVLCLLIGGIVWSVTSSTSEDDPMNHVTGIRNWKIAVNEEGVDFMKGVTWDEDYINKVTVYAEDVDIATVGEYTIVYQIDVKGTSDDLKEERNVEVVTEEEAQEVTAEEQATEEANTAQSNENSTNASTKSESSKEELKNSSSNKNTSSSGTNSSSNNSGSSSGNSGSSHTHNWQPVYTTVHHDAVYQQQWVVDQAAWNEERSICNQCGADITGNIDAHFKAAIASGASCGGYHSEWISHPEQGHYENVLVSAAYDEQVLSGYKCSCGATR